MLVSSVLLGGSLIGLKFVQSPWQFYMLFGVSHLINVPDAFVVFQFSQFDNYSYLFNQPYFISLDQTAIPQDLAIRGMRIGINGREPEVGQAYQKLDMSLNATDYSALTGQPLSRIGTILGIEKGTQDDEFFLTFEEIGGNTNLVVEPIPDPLPPAADGAPMPDIGIKTFDEISASMSAVTGMPTSHPDVLDTFTTIRQQLPSVADVEGFLSSQQMAVTQLAIEYCNALVEDTSQRAIFFPAFNFLAVPAVALDSAGRDALLDPLLDSVLCINLISQPDRNLVRAELDTLAVNLAASGGDVERTETIVKATCAAVLGSGAILIQ